MHPAATELLVCPASIISLKRGTAGGTGNGGRVKPATNDRIITGVAAVFGNVDVQDDVLVPGSFATAIKDFYSGKSRVRHLWNHISSEPPTARILELRELSKHELPSELRSNPDVTGGLLVKRQYLTDYYADRVFRAVSAGTIREMSFAFVADDFSYADRDGKKVREVKSVSLFDTSDVNWGANSATAAMIGKAVILNTESIAKMREKRLKDIERREQLEQLRYFTKRLPRQPLNKQQWDNQMRLNRAKLETLHLEARLLT